MNDVLEDLAIFLLWTTFVFHNPYKNRICIKDYLEQHI